MGMAADITFCSMVVDIDIRGPGVPILVRLDDDDVVLAAFVFVLDVVLAVPFRRCRMGVCLA